MIKPYSRAWLPALGVFIGGLFLFTMGLCHQEIIGFESRFYLFALEMWRHGPTWMPTIYGTPYPDYPATTTFFIYLFAKLIGHLNKWVAVFPSALCAAVTLTTVYLLGSLYDKKLGWYAVFLLLLTNTFLVEARTISPDQYITMVTTLCFYLAYSAQHFKSNSRLLFIPLLLLLGFACRGPIGLVVPAGVLCIFYLTDNNVKAFLLVSVAAVALLCLGCLLLFGVAEHVGGKALMQAVLHQEISGRFVDAQLPWYFYFIESLGAYALTYPLVVLMVPGLMLKPRQNKFLQKLIGWVLVILIGMSLPAGKKVRYVLAMAPALALIAAYLLAIPHREKYLLELKKICRWILYFFPILCLVAVLIMEICLAAQTQKFHIHFSWLIIILLVSQWINYLLRYQELTPVVISALVFVLLIVCLKEPIDLASNHTRQFVRNIEGARRLANAKLVFYQESPDGLPIKYIINMPREEKPIFIDSTKAMLAIKPPVFFVTGVENFAQLPESIHASSEVLFQGELGHDKVVIFKKRTQ